MRIAIAGLLQESLSFSSVKTEKKDFFIYRRHQLLDYFNLDPVAKKLDIELVPVLSIRSVW